jgi:hypothetical protein
MQQELIGPIQYAAFESSYRGRVPQEVQMQSPGHREIAFVLAGTMIARHKDAAHSGVRRRGAWRRKSGFTPPRLLSNPPSSRLNVRQTLVCRQASTS